MGWVGDANGEILVSACDAAVEARTPATRLPRARLQSRDVRDLQAMPPSAIDPSSQLLYKDGGGMKAVKPAVSSQ
ncbi:hypothetical protein CQ12_00745 [Bradyrhizobium jicamae]|uniref:Uncharacterized protein n=1 Tax=Bradyrhizobium jicamae TaxID=280332 RepID=A0A0R3LPW8_9BRAD|nr:hypothetical protein CQ12_00745 [Bradyrhizobium jicamae]